MTANHTYIKNLNEHLSVVRGLLENEKFKPFFYIKKGQVHQEKEVVDSSGNTKRIDRLIITPEEAWIVDYKSAKEESEKYASQIAEYMKIVSEIHPKLKVKGFLIYLDNMGMEEVNG